MNLLRLLRFAPTLAILAAMLYAGQAVNEILASRPAPPSENPAAVLAKLGLDALAGEPEADVLAIRRLRDPFNLDAKSAAAAGAKAIAKAPQEDRLADFVEQAVLNATIIQGKTRLAVINGKLYKQGEAVAVAGRGASPLVVKTVKRHEVELGAEGRRFTLTYTDRLTKGKSGGRRAGASWRVPAAGVGPTGAPDPPFAAIRTLLGPQLGAVGASLAGALGVQPLAAGPSAGAGPTAPSRAPRTIP
jgi:hypothetical protein